MLNYIWAAMILIGILYATLQGNIASVTEAALSSAGEAVSLCITMAGIMALWMGLMEIAQKTGMIEQMTGAIQPLLTFLFPRIPKNHMAREYIATNFIANIMGLGWACTPAGLKAMEALADLERERGNPEYIEEGVYAREDNRKKGKRERRASGEMCTFLVLNISSLQLIPVNIIAYRSKYGSTNPAAVLAPAIVATLVSTLAAVLFCKLADCLKTKSML